MLSNTLQAPPPPLQALAAPLDLVRSTNSTPRPSNTLVPPKSCLAPRGGYYLTCDHRAVIWRPKRCRRCEPCKAARRGKVIARVLNAMGSLKWMVMVTVTTVPQLKLGQGEYIWPSWKTIMSWWSRTAAWIRRTAAPDMQYVAIKEEGQQHGMRHLHCILSGVVWLEEWDLSTWWMRISGAYNVDVTRVWGKEGVSAYLAKYLGKAPLPLRKSVTYSQGFPKLSGGLCYVLEAGWPPPVQLVSWVDVLEDGSKVANWGDDGPCACFGSRHLLE